MKITQIAPMLKRLLLPVTEAMELVSTLLESELVIRTRDDDIRRDLCR